MAPFLAYWLVGQIGYYVQKQIPVIKTTMSSSLHGALWEDWEGLEKEQRSRDAREGKVLEASPLLGGTPAPLLPPVTMDSHPAKPTHTFLFTQTMCPRGPEELLPEAAHLFPPRMESQVDPGVSSLQRGRQRGQGAV